MRVGTGLYSGKITRNKIEIPFDTSFAEAIVLNGKLEERMLAMLDPFRQETHGDMCMCAVNS